MAPCGSSIQPAHQPVGVVRGSEEQHLTHHVEQTVGQEARLEGTGAGQEHWYTYRNDRLGCPEGRLTTPNRNLRSACGSPAAAVLRPQSVHRGALARTRPRANEASSDHRSGALDAQPRPASGSLADAAGAGRDPPVRREAHAQVDQAGPARRQAHALWLDRGRARRAAGQRTGAGDREDAPVRVVPDLAQVRGALRARAGPRAPPSSRSARRPARRSARRCRRASGDSAPA